MIHRHLDYADDIPVAQRGAAAIDDLLERGDLLGWAPLAAAVEADPFGDLAARIERIMQAHPVYGTTPLWRAWIARCRARPTRLAALRRAAGMTQAEVAEQMGLTQPDISKLEARRDLRLSSLEAYAIAVGAQARVVAYLADGTTLVISPRVT